MKYKFEGIGTLGATLMSGALAASPFAFLTTGIWGKITFWVLQKASAYFANKGLIFLNVGVEAVSAYSDRKDFDGSFESAIRIVNEHGDNLTDAEKKAIDDSVIAAFDKFSNFGGLRNGRNTGSKP